MDLKGDGVYKSIHLSNSLAFLKFVEGGGGLCRRELSLVIYLDGVGFAIVVRANYLTVLEVYRDYRLRHCARHDVVRVSEPMSRAALRES